MGLLYPGVDDEDVMQWYLNTHYLDGILDYQPQSSSGAAYKSAVDDWIPYFNDMMDDWTPSSEPTPIGGGVDPGPFFPIDDQEPLVLFQRMTGDSWIWDYGTESYYNKLLSESTPGFVGAAGEQVVDIGPPNSSILAAMGK